MEKETWKAVVGYEGLYEVSDMGRVRSLDRLCNSKEGSTQLKRGKLLKESEHKKAPYNSYTLIRDGKREKIRTHIIVAKAFLNYIPNKGVIVCDHINEDKRDNRLCNLQIISCGENSRKSSVHRNGFLGGKKSLFIPRKQTSKYKGVSLDARTSKWKVTLPKSFSKRHGGYFACEFSAHIFYQKMCFSAM